jgi:hypothetical protein
VSDPINVVFHSPATCDISPMVYLHWGGGTVLNDLEGALPRLRTGNAGYACARFIGYCHEKLDGINSLGVNNLWFPDLKDGEEFFSVYRRVMESLARNSEVIRVNVETWVVEQGTALVKRLPPERAGDRSGFNRPSGVVQVPVETGQAVPEKTVPEEAGQVPHEPGT